MEINQSLTNKEGDVGGHYRNKTGQKLKETLDDIMKTNQQHWQITLTDYKDFVEEHIMESNQLRIWLVNVSKLSNLPCYNNQ